MNQRAKSWIKNAKFVGRVYFVVVFAVIKILQLFVKPQEDRILFMSYSGRQYSDTPKEAYLALKDDPEFANFEFFWAFNEPDKFPQVDTAHKVNSNSPLFFLELLKSRYWIANSSIERLVPFKHPRNIYIQFWHGIPMKTLGRDEKGLAPLVRYWYKHAQFDYLFTYGQYDAEKFKRIFPQTKHILNVGQLRKRIVIRRAKKGREKLLKEFGVTGDKPVLLYVPTFRSYQPTVATNFSIGFLEKLAENYTVLYRGHYFDTDNQPKNLELVNRKSLYKLFAIADMLVTDYSSVIFDYAALEKPIYLFQPDIDEYKLKRGLYLAGEDTNLPVAHSEQELWELLAQPYNQANVEQLLQQYNAHQPDEALITLKDIIKNAQ